MVGTACSVLNTISVIAADGGVSAVPTVAASNILEVLSCRRHTGNVSFCVYVVTSLMQWPVTGATDL